MPDLISCAGVTRSGALQAYRHVHVYVNVHVSCIHVRTCTSVTYMYMYVNFAVIEFLPAELKSRLSQIREQDEHVQSKC